MKRFFSNLNARLMSIHFLAFLFFFYAFQTLSFLHDYDFLYKISEHTNRLNFPDRFNADMRLIEQAGNFGLIVAYIISWAVSSKRNWFWANSALVFVLWFSLKNFVFIHWHYYNYTIISPGGPFKIYSFWGHIVLGTALLALGLVLFFSKRISNYVDGNLLTGKKAASTNKKGTKAKM